MMLLRRLRGGAGLPLMRHMVREMHTTADGTTDGTEAVPQVTSAAELETSWMEAMRQRYGAGNYDLFRSLYKDLCDELRREYYSKPPPPHAESRRMASSTPDDAPATPSAKGEWGVTYQPANNLLVFERPAMGEMGRVVAYSTVEMRDPPKLNALLTFANWIPVEVLIQRHDVVLHFSMASNEGGMHMRNVRVYDAGPTGSTAQALDDAQGDGDATTDAAASCASAVPGRSPMDVLLSTAPEDIVRRQRRLYDGPCLWHLELGVQNELYDVMQDHGITLDWINWMAQWVSYMEHRQYVRWSLGLLGELIPTSQRGPESDFLTEGERAALDAPAEDWLDAHRR